MQKGLTTDDGKIVGWYETVETYLPDAAMDVLEQNGMTFANTLLEMFQQITQLRMRAFSRMKAWHPSATPVTVA